MAEKLSYKELEQRIQKNISLIQTLEEENETLEGINEAFAGQVNTLTVESEIARLEFVQVFDAVSDPLWVIDTKHTILRVNTTFVALFGIESKAFAIGKKCYEILNSCLCRTENCPLAFIKNKRQMIEIETILEIKKEIGVPFLLTGAPLIGLAHETIGAVVQFKDISERKVFEEAMEENNKKLEELARVDGLTQIANRRVFDETLKKEWARTQRSHKPISLLMIDIDFFKLYNDNYGHAKGDECLKQVANAISNCFHRSNDLAARYGGEEFGCILPETDLKGAATVAESVLNAVRDCKITHEYSAVAGIVTVSIGCFCMFPESKDKHTVLIAEADKLLYKSKEFGRDRVTTILR
jgi:diguanylate cyclase (GGDEF)-like protein/PAS domain S-box-containing protein